MPDIEPSINGEPTVVTQTSIGGKLLNMFVAPTEVFDEIKASPNQAANWLAPVILSMIMGIIYTMVIYSQPQVLQNMRDAQEKKMQEMVDKGKLTRQQADQSLAVTEKIFSPGVMKTFGIIAVLFFQAVFLVLCTTLLWLIGKFALKGPAEFLKCLEVMGLTTIVGIPDWIIRLLLGIIYANPSMSPGPVLLVAGHFDPQNKWHMALAMMDVFLFWQIALWALGLSRLTGKSFTKSLIWLLICIGCIAGVIVGIVLMLSNMAEKLGGK